MASTVTPEIFATLASREADRRRKDLSPSWVVAVQATHETDYTHYRRHLYLDVRYEILSCDMGRPDFKWSPDLAPRINAALLIKDPTPKSIRLDRRLLNARAFHARSTKARKAVQP